MPLPSPKGVAQGFLGLISTAASLAPPVVIYDRNQPSNAPARMMRNEHSTAGRPRSGHHHEDEFPPLLQQDSSMSHSTLSAARSGDSNDQPAFNIADSSADPGRSKQASSSGGSKQYQPFPIILMKLLQDPTHSNVISFRPDGRSFVIKDSNAFISTLMPEIFHLRRLDTFFRKLERWGFQSLTGEGCYTFFHTEDKFREGDYEMCRKIRRMSLEEIKLKSKQRQKVMRKRRHSNPKAKPRSSTAPPTTGIFQAQDAAPSSDVSYRRRPGQMLPFSHTRLPKMPDVTKMSDAELRMFANSVAVPAVQDGIYNYNSRSAAGNISNGVRAAGSFAGSSFDHETSTDDEDDDEHEQQLQQQRPALPITDFYDHPPPAASNGTSEGENNKQTKTTTPNSPIGGNSKNKYQPFPVILMQLLQDPKNFNILSFRAGGRAFIIKDPTTFASKLMPDAFHLRRLEVFLRKLHRWGFRSLQPELGGPASHPSRPPFGMGAVDDFPYEMMRYAFYHVEDKFRAGDLELCKSIRRLTLKDMARMSQQQQQQQYQHQLQHHHDPEKQFPSRSRHTPSLALDHFKDISMDAMVHWHRSGEALPVPYRLSLSRSKLITDAELHMVTEDVVLAAVETLRRGGGSSPVVRQQLHRGRDGVACSAEQRRKEADDLILHLR